jgi:autotransporter-associated beta strand protein
VTANLVTNSVNSTIDLSVTVVDPLTWNGDLSGLWEIAGAANWKNSGGGGLQYLETTSLDLLNFDDTAAGNWENITLSTNVTPGSLTFNNVSKDYTVKGVGGIGGFTGLRKTGTGSLTLATTNTFTGETLISAGTLVVSNSLSLQGSVVNNASGNVRFGKAITAFTFGGLSGAADIALTNGSGTAVTLTVGGNAVNTTYSGRLLGSGTLATLLTKTGAGSVVLSGSNTFHTLAINQGRVEIPSAGSFNSGATVDPILIGGSTLDVATLLINGGTVNISGGKSFSVGETATLTGKVIQVGGIVNSQGPIRMACSEATSKADYYMTNGIINLSNKSTGYILCGRNGLGTFNQVGGSVTIQRADMLENSGSVMLGFEATANGLYLLDGGTLTVTNNGIGALIGRNGTGTLTITNQATATINSLVLGMYAGSTGTVNLASGELRFNVMRRSWIGALTVANFNWSQGTLRPFRVDAVVSNNLTLTGAGAVVNTRDTFGIARKMTISSVIGESGGSYGLTKGGEGTLILTSSNTYSGVTLVTNGTLQVNNSTGSATGLGDVIVTNATLSGTGSMAGNLTVNAGGSLVPGLTNTVAAVLTCGGDLTLNAGATNVFGCTLTTNSSVSVIGKLKVQGANVVQLDSDEPLELGEINIFTVGSFEGEANLSSWQVLGVPANYATRVVYKDNRVVVTIVPRGSLIRFM